jgi:hypothetical protein
VTQPTPTPERPDARGLADLAFAQLAELQQLKSPERCQMLDGDVWKYNNRPTQQDGHRTQAERDRVQIAALESTTALLVQLAGIAAQIEQTTQQQAVRGNTRRRADADDY